jgi:hypothetical protein
MGRDAKMMRTHHERKAFQSGKVIEGWQEKFPAPEVET